MSSLCISLTCKGDRTPTVRLSAAATVHLLGEDADTSLCGREMPDAAPGRVDGGDPEHSAWCQRCLQIQSDA